MTQTVLVAGATGMLGARIAHHLLQHPDVAVRLLVRPATRDDAAKRARLTPLTDRGATLVTGDLADTPSLARATSGVDVVVSAVQGGADVIVEGQRALAVAARDNGVRRIMPSDFALDFFRSPPGGLLPFDLRREAAAAIADVGLEHVHVLNGAFMDVFLAPHAPMIDLDAGVARFWGTGDERFEATSVEDTARYTARAALDPTLPSGPFAVAGERLSVNAVADAVEGVTGRALRRESRGPVDALRASIADTRAHDPNPWATTVATYQLYMATGEAALPALQNARYPDITPERFVDFARRALGERAAAGAGRG